MAVRNKFGTTLSRAVVMIALVVAQLLLPLAAPATAVPSEAAWVGSFTYRLVAVDPTYEARFTRTVGYNIDVWVDGEGNQHFTATLTEWTYEDGANDGSLTCKATLLPGDYTYTDNDVHFGEIDGRLYMNGRDSISQTLLINYRHQCPGSPAHDRSQEWGAAPWYECPAKQDGPWVSYPVDLGSFSRTGNTGRAASAHVRKCTSIFDEEITESITPDLTGSYAARSTSTISGHLSRQVFTRGTTVWLTLTVTAKPTVPITGRVALFDRTRKIKSFVLTAANSGRVRAKLPRLSVGKHRISARYFGSETVAASRTGTAIVTVMKRRS